jgi:flagellar hook-basal body complex protein FliE
MPAGINGLGKGPGPVSPVPPRAQPASAHTEPALSFGAALRQAIEQLPKLQQDADAAARELATGGEIELHDAMLALEQASLGFQLALTIRNKVVEAYQEVMRTQM